MSRKTTKWAEKPLEIKLVAFVVFNDNIVYILLAWDTEYGE